MIIKQNAFLSYLCPHPHIKDTTNNPNPQSDNNNKINGANMGSIWGRQDPGGPHLGPMNFAIWETILMYWSYDGNQMNNHWLICNKIAKMSSFSY